MLWWLWWQLIQCWIRSHKMSNDTKCQMTQNVKWHKISNGTKCQMTRNFKWHEMTHDTWHMTHDKWQIRHDKWHMKLNFKLHITHMTHDTWHMTHEVWCMMHDTWRMMINDSRQKHPASHTSERTFVPRTAIFSSEGALYVILPYDYTPTFWKHTGPWQQLEHKCYDDFGDN